MEWILIIEDRVHWEFLVITVMNVYVPKQHEISSLT
jgi:hypothetical protein